MAKSGRKPSGAGIWLYGRHAVAAALANPERRWRRLVVLAGHENEASALVAGARAARRGSGAAISALDQNGFAAILPRHAVHQGLALEVEPLPEPGLEDVLQTDPASGPHRDPGTTMDHRRPRPAERPAEHWRGVAFGSRVRRTCGPHPGARGTTADRSACQSGLGRSGECAAGARRQSRPCARSLKEAGFWICGLDETAPLSLAQTDIGERVAIVLGSEGGGIRRLVRERCDFRARLPTRPAQPTLNVSNAAAVALYELTRGRGD